MKSIEKIEEEVLQLKELQEQWINDTPNKFHALDVFSDIENFRDNTDINFPNVNKFYFNFNEEGDIYFGDAADELKTYLDGDDETHYHRGMKHLKDGFAYLFKHLTKMQNRINLQNE